MSVAEHHRTVAARFTERVEGTSDWDAPAPVDGWTARDVVRHLVEWFPAFLADGGVPIPAQDVDADGPETAWRQHADVVQGMLDDPESAERTFDHPQVGSLPLPDAVERFYTADVFMHTWDLSRATGQDDTLDEEFCAVMVEGMTPIKQLLYDSGQYGPEIPVPADADPQTRLLGLIGRDPQWRPPGG